MNPRLPAASPVSRAAHAAQHLAGLACLLSSVSLLASGSAQASGSFSTGPSHRVETGRSTLELPSLYLLHAGGMRGADKLLGAMTDVDAISTSNTPRFAAAIGSRPPRASLVEMPADVIPGRYNRPKYALGFRSNGMKKFADSMGLDAHTCLAPLVRARINLSQDGDAGGRLMVFARCSLR